ncbi:MAG TPA: 2-amino-4-hydroxy-6-hydroxymethyldihydropteridine diphosphokinase [Fimbriimonadaceae bacterium]|jgi:2-amino-4-hydroxy-6-hydroxymethyldihydropteridine diphosphokinase
MAKVAISLGSNLGDRLNNLRTAIAELEKHLTIQKVSHPYETAPMYVEDQPAFINAALLAETKTGPLPLLHLLKQIERQIGRQDAPRFGPREIDLDLISYGAAQYKFREAHIEKLVLPHPRAIERRFVLQPLYEIDPNFNLPGLGTIAQLLPSTELQAQTVKKLSDALLPILSH